MGLKAEGFPMALCLEFLGQTSPIDLLLDLSAHTSLEMLVCVCVCVLGVL